MTLVGHDRRGFLHAAREGEPCFTALCHAPVVALARLVDVHPHKATDGPMCDRCSALIRAARDEGTTVCSA